MMASAALSQKEQQHWSSEIIKTCLANSNDLRALLDEEQLLFQVQPSSPYGRLTSVVLHQVVEAEPRLHGSVVKEPCTGKDYYLVGLLQPRQEPGGP